MGNTHEGGLRAKEKCLQLHPEYYSIIGRDGQKKSTTHVRVPCKGCERSIAKSGMGQHVRANHPELTHGGQI